MLNQYSSNEDHELFEHADQFDIQQGANFNFQLGYINNQLNSTIDQSCIVEDLFFAKLQLYALKIELDKQLREVENFAQNLTFQNVSRILTLFYVLTSKYSLDYQNTLNAHEPICLEFHDYTSQQKKCFQGFLIKIIKEENLKGSKRLDEFCQSLKSSQLDREKELFNQKGLQIKQQLYGAQIQSLNLQKEYTSLLTKFKHQSNQLQLLKEENNYLRNQLEKQGQKLEKQDQKLKKAQLNTQLISNQVQRLSKKFEDKILLLNSKLAVSNLQIDSLREKIDQLLKEKAQQDAQLSRVLQMNQLLQNKVTHLQRENVRLNARLKVSESFNNKLKGAN